MNHYCAITRVDYHEFRHCLESAASALASHATRAHLCIPIVAHIAFILAICAIVKYRRHCELLIEWMYFRLVDGLVNILLAKCVITLLVDLVHKLRFKRLNRIVAPAPVPTTSKATTTTELCAPLPLPASPSSHNIVDGGSSAIHTKSTVFVHEKCSQQEVLRLKMPLEPKSNRRRRR